MKHYYIVYSVDYKNTPSLFGLPYDEKKRYCADVLKVSTSDNIVFALDCIGGLTHANICETKKEAYQIKDEWNERYKLNGTYYY